LVNVNVVKNDVNMLLQTENNFDLDNTQYCVQNVSNNIVNGLEFNLMDNKLVVCNENFHNELLDVATFELND